MTAFVADTHAVIWHLTEPRRLGKAAVRALSAADSGRWLCHVPAIVLVEAALLYERGRIRIGPGQVLDALSGHAGYAILPLDIEQVIQFGGLPAIRDPMDRLVGSAARALDVRLVSSDETFDGSGIDRIWD